MKLKKVKIKICGVKNTITLDCCSENHINRRRSYCFEENWIYINSSKIKLEDKNINNILKKYTYDKYSYILVFTKATDVSDMIIYPIKEIQEEEEDEEIEEDITEIIKLEDEYNLDNIGIESKKLSEDGIEILIKNEKKFKFIIKNNSDGIKITPIVDNKEITFQTFVTNLQNNTFLKLFGVSLHLEYNNC